MLKHKQAAVPYRATAAATRPAVGNVNQAYLPSPESEPVFYISDDLRPYNFNNTLTSNSNSNANSFSRYNPHPGTHRNNFSNVVCTPVGAVVQQQPPSDINSFGKSGGGASIPNLSNQFNLNSSASLINNFSNEEFLNAASASTNYHHARVEAPVAPRHHHGSQLNKNSKTSQTQVSLISSSSRSSPPVSQASPQPSPPPRPVKSSTSVVKSNSICNRKCIVVALIVVALVCIIGIVAGVTFVVINLNSNQQQQQQQQDTNKHNNNNSNSPVMDPSSTSTDDLTGVKRPTASSASTLAPMKEMNPGSQYAGELNSELEPSTCGQQAIKPFQKYLRIINGNEAIPHSWPWVASIAYFGPRSSLPHACGAVLVNKRFLVTATHCVLKSTIFSLVGAPIANSTKYGSLEKMMRVYLGIHRRSTDVTKETTFYAEKVISYPNFDTGTFQNDLSIIKLNQDVSESESVNFLCLTNNTSTQPGTNVYAVGWGYTLENFSSASDTLNQVSFEIQSFKSCGLNYIPSLQFCAGDPGRRRDTCNGDSGGPIMSYSNDQWNLAGVVSNGDAVCTGKGIYTNVAHYYNWIVNTMNKNMK